MDIVRVVRILEYVGDRDAVEWQISQSIHGERSFAITGKGRATIRAATLGTFPEILETNIEKTNGPE